jgi:DNA-binding protein H-NS
MVTYQELKAQLGALTERIEAAKSAERATVIEDIRSKVIAYGLTAEDLRGQERVAAKPFKPKLPPKYRDPATGATWSGRGPTPMWLRGKARAAFLIAT